MAVVVKEYRSYKCVRCGKRTKTERKTEGYVFGSPFYSCPHCGAVNYDPYIYEPALLSKAKLTENSRKSWNTLLLLLYMPLGLFAFFALSLALSGFLYGFLIVAPILLVLTIIILKKRNSLDGFSCYKEDLDKSMLRLQQSSKYADAVIHLQGMDSDSLYSELVGSISVDSQKVIYNKIGKEHDINRSVSNMMKGFLSFIRRKKSHSAENNTTELTDQNHIFPQYEIAFLFLDEKNPFVPYYREINQNADWKIAPNTGYLYYDPIEDDPSFKKIEKKIEEMVDSELGELKGKFGSCHAAWAIKKRLLQEHYGIIWHSVSDMNPGCCFD